MGFNKENYEQALLFFKDNDSKIYEIMKKRKYIAPPVPKNIFSHLVGSIIGQKIKFSMAQKQRKQLYIELGTHNFTIDDMINRGILYLQDQNINNFDLDLVINEGLKFLLDIGIDEVRVKTIQRAIDYLTTHNIELSKPQQLDELINIKGIKDWTINCTKIMHSLDSDDTIFDDCLLYQDLIIRRGIEQLYGLSKKEEIIELSKSWSPWRGIVTWYLWKEFT